MCVHNAAENTETIMNNPRRCARCLLDRFVTTPPLAEHPFSAVGRMVVYIQCIISIIHLIYICITAGITSLRCLFVCVFYYVYTSTYVQVCIGTSCPTECFGQHYFTINDIIQCMIRVDSCLLFYCSVLMYNIIIMLMRFSSCIYYGRLKNK